MKKLLLITFSLLSLWMLASCTTPEITVTYVTNGGSLVAKETVSQGTSIDEPDTTKEGYSFTGWYADVTLTTLFNFEETIIRNITLYAGWSINQYLLTFQFNNGADDYVVSANYSYSFDAPQEPTLEGHTFGGWYEDASYETEFTKSTMPSKNMTIYAKWIPHILTVNFYYNDDDTPTYSEEVSYGDDVIHVPSIPVITGQIGSWNQTLTHITSDLDVRLIYTPETYTITFIDETGTTYDMLTVDYGEHIIPNDPPSKTGYDFIGYYSETLERNIDLSIYTVTEDLTLQTVYQIQTFSVQFYGGETGALIGGVQIIPYGSPAVAPTTDYEKTGYTFDGWDVDFSNITTNLVVHATYTINAYDALFDANGGIYQDSQTTKTVTADYNASLTVPEEPTKSGFIFVGWFEEPTGDNDVYFGSTGISMPVNGLTVYAHWIELVGTTYTVSGTYYYEAEGIASDALSTTGIYTTIGSEAYTPFVNIYYDTDMSPIREIEGYTFYKLVYNGNEYYDPHMTLTITEDETVDVYYRKMILTVTFSDRIDDVYVTTTYYVPYNGTLENIPTPTLEAGYDVALWENQDFTNIKSHMNVAKMQYSTSYQTIVFMSNTTILYVAINDGTPFTHEELLSLESPLWSLAENRYVFEGWYIQGTDTRVMQADLYFDDIYFSSNYTVLEARWKALDELHAPTNISVETDDVNETITITFDLDPVLVETESIYAMDFELILNGQYIVSLPGDALIDYAIRDDYHFTMTFDQTSPYYDDLSSLYDPGVHALQMVAVGDDTTVLSSDVSTVSYITVTSIYDGIPESAIINDYYIIEDFGGGTLRYIFYLNLTYQFSNKTFEILTGSNHITADGNTLSTTAIPGDFTFTITDNDGTRTYQGLVVADIRQFDLGADYQTFLAETDEFTETHTFISESPTSIYHVGSNNDFYLDLLIRNNNGSKINLSDVLLDYTFYLDDNSLALDDVERLEYVALNGNIMDFTSLAIGHQFTIVVEPRYEALKMDMNPLTFKVTVNDGYNAFTNADLKALFADMDVHTINILRDIEASLSTNQLYSDGTPRNFLASAENNYQTAANVYYRIHGSTDDDQLTIQGNFMTIDGSALPYINPDRSEDGLISYAASFKIVSTQIGLFYYSVKQSEPINNNAFTINNLRLLGNTTTPSVNYGGTQEEIVNQERLMSQNSGGILGVVVRAGKAELNNLVIGYTVIGVTTNAYGENALAEPLTVDLSDVSIYDSWANSIYLWGGSGINLIRSDIASSGGAAIHFEDIHPGSTGYDDPVLILDEATTINNWISGQEAWFKAYGMSPVALALKSNINAGVEALGKTIIQTRTNPVTGLDSEMINLVFLSLPMSRAVTLENPDNESSIISASEVSFNISDDTGTTQLDRTWNFTDSSDPRISGGQYGFALGSLSDTASFLQMVTDFMTGTYGVTLSQNDAGNLATIAGFYNLSAPEVLNVAGLMQDPYDMTLHEAIIYMKGSLDYPQPRFIEVISPNPLSSAAGNVTVLIEVFNQE